MLITELIPANPSPVSVDVEWLVQWAISKTGNLPWSRDRDRELAFDKGLSAKPKKRPPGNWILAEACAGLRFGNNDRPLPAHLTPPNDARLVMEAITRLDHRTAATLRACARAKIRPDWMPGVEPKLCEKKCYGKKKNGKRRGRPFIQRWYDPDPEAIRAAREVYTRWHTALTAMIAALDGRLSGFRINGLSAPAEPWLIPFEKSA